jgi:hypothetical protein
MSEPAAMAVANDQTIMAMIQGARRRLVVMAPGISKVIAHAIGARWVELGGEAIMVILDVDPEVCRMGYGEIEAIQHLDRIAASLDAMVNHHAGLRIGVVIADDETLIFAPTPLLIEAGPRTHNDVAPCKPNAIRMSIPPADVERDLGLGIDGGLDRTIGLDKADHATIKRVGTELAANPPQRFDISRSVRVFNAQFEFVEIEVKGALLQRKTIRIPNELLGIGDDEALDFSMRATLRVINEDSPISGSFLQAWRGLIIKRYLKHIPSHGFILMRKDKPKFERAISRLQRAVNRFQEQVRTRLAAELLARRRTLTVLLAQYIERRPSERIQRMLKWMPIENIVDDELRPLFRDALRWAESISMRVTYKGVTYESLNDARFMAAVRLSLPDANQLFEEFDVAPAAPRPPTPLIQLKGAA